MRLLAEGLSTEEVAGRLGIDKSTAFAHRTHILRKLDFDRVTQLVRWAIEEGVA